MKTYGALTVNVPHIISLDTRQRKNVTSKTVKVNLFLPSTNTTNVSRRHPGKALRILNLCNSWTFWGIPRSGYFNFRIEGMVPAGYETGRGGKYPLINIYVEKSKDNI